MSPLRPETVHRRGDIILTPAILLVSSEAQQNHIFGEQKALNRSLRNFAHQVPSMM